MPQADDDFRQYAPNTGEWREAASNLLGVCNDALETGRRLRDDALTVIAAHNQVVAEMQAMADKLKAGVTAGRDLAQKMVDTWGSR